MGSKTALAALLEGLDDEQVAAVTSGSRALCVIAGAGSGKTGVLSRRVAYRALEATAPSARTLVLTFTRAAAGELSSRLAALGSGELDPPTAGTFHSVALAQLKRWYSDSLRRPPAVVAKPSDLLQRIIAGMTSGSAQGPSTAALGTRRAPGSSASPGSSAPGKDLKEMASLVVTEVSWSKACQIPPGDYLAAARARSRLGAAAQEVVLALGFRGGDPYEAVAKIYEVYEEEKKRRHVVDFDDLLHRCANALEQDSAFRDRQRWLFRHVLVDEAQDMNPLQLRLLRGWMADEPDLCLVGDPNQAIYSWNGSDPGLMSEIVLSTPGMETVRLTKNYRSTPQILAAAGPRAPQSTRPPGSLPRVIEFADSSSEAAGIAGEVLALHDRGIPWSSMAALVRTNSQIPELKEALKTKNVPVGLSGDVVAVSTFHRAKGKEWEAVFVCGAVEGLVPLKWSDSAEELAEEERLFYVALTRARTELCISWYSPSRPSRYLDAIGDSALRLSHQDRLARLDKETSSLMLAAARRALG